MAGGGKQNSGSGGSGGSTKLSYNGGSVPGTFDPKTFGTTLMSDASKAYQQGPKINPISGFTPFSTQTQGLIDSGLARNSAMQGNSTLQGMASGNYLGNGNPYLNDQLQQTRDNVLKDVSSQFTNSGRFGGGSYVDTAVGSLANAENSARFGQYNTDVSNMFNANSALDASNANALGYSGLLDSKAKELTAANQQQWDATHNADFNQIAKYLGLLNGNQDNTNKPVSLWDILGGVGSVAGAFL